MSFRSTALCSCVSQRSRYTAYAPAALLATALSFHEGSWRKRMRHFYACCTATAIVGALLARPSTAHAELLIGLTSQNALISFDSATPGTVGATVPVTGLGAGESLLAIDIRPATGQLYAL